MAAPDLTPGDWLSHFRIIELIGTGGFGHVYRALDTHLNRDVAIKVLNEKTVSDASARKRFRREAEILSRLMHGNIAAVHDFHSDNGIDYLVMEYVAGKSLSEPPETGARPEKEVLDLGIQLARGLAYAHSQRVLHRDLKPGNLRVTPENNLKILDFGLAQLFALPEDNTVTTDKSMVQQNPCAGTPAYLSPEQVDWQEPDVRSDIYSAGVVLYELATGSRPFPQQGESLRMAVLHSPPPAPRLKNKEISPGLEAVILKCLEKDPQLRYQSANELLDDLKELARGSGPHRAVGVRQKAGWLSPRWLVLSLVLIVGIAAGIVFWNRILEWVGKGQPPMQQKIMAVLPIDTVGQDPATSALGLGLTETVTAKLVQASDTDAIQVVSPRDLRDKGVKTAEDARREFGTDLVLESSLQRSGQTIRINCYLVDSRTHRQVAAKSIEAEITNPFGLQDKVLSAALDMLPTRISSEQRRKLSVQQNTQPAAYEAYIRGRGYLQEYEKPENIDSAITEFERAVQIDSSYAPAYAGLGEAYGIGYQQLNRGKDWLTKASTSCEKALSIAPGLAAGHTCLGNVLKATGQYDKAAEQFQRAIDLDPDSEAALIGLADSYQKLNNPSAAETTYKRVISLRPNYWGVYSWLGVFYYNQARYADAAGMFRRVTELAPDNYRGYSNLGAMYLYEGRYQDAIDASKRSIDLRPNLDAYGNLGAAFFLLHRYAEAADTFRQSLKLDDRDFMNWGNLGDALYWSPGRRSESVGAYKEAIARTRAKLGVNSKDGTTLAYLAHYCAMTGDKVCALSNLEKALMISPADTDIMAMAASIHIQFEDKEQALSWLKKAVKAGYSRSSVRDAPEFVVLDDDPGFRALLNSK